MWRAVNTDSQHPVTAFVPHRAPMGADMAQLQQDGEKLKDIWGSRDSNILVVEGPTTDAALANGRAVAQALRVQEPENKIGTLTDVWPSPEQAQANVQRWEAFAKAEGPRVQALLASAAQRYGFTAEAFAPFTQLLERPVAQFDPSVLRAAGLGEMVDVFLHGPDLTCAKLTFGCIIRRGKSAFLTSRRSRTMCAFLC